MRCRIGDRNNCITYCIRFTYHSVPKSSSFPSTTTATRKRNSKVMKTGLHRRIGRKVFNYYEHLERNFHSYEVRPRMEFTMRALTIPSFFLDYKIYRCAFNGALQRFRTCSPNREKLINSRLSAPPIFADATKRRCTNLSIRPPIYLHTPGEVNAFYNLCGHFDA